jgi:uncharacterized phage-like protein YoqJ
LDKVGGYDENNDLAHAVKEELDNQILEAILGGYTHFIVGGAIGVDTWSAESVLFYRDEMGFNITIDLYRPFEGQERMWNSDTKKRYFDIAERCDNVVTVCDGGYAPWKMQKRNEAMVDDADLVIAVWDGTSGGTENCVKYAEKQGKEIIRINPLEV